MKIKIKVEKKEILFFFIGTIFILLWFLYLRNLISHFLFNLHPFIAMLLFQTGLFIGLTFLSSMLDSWKVKLGVSSIIFLIIVGIDIIVAPYLVDINGIINKSVEMWYVSADVGFGALYSLFLPSNLIWYAVYIFTPILLIFIIPILISNRRIIKKAFQ